MAQRPQPSLRFADGGSFITRWAQSARLQDGGVVPGSGRGDKIPAKYEPGEFVVSNDMIDDNPGLREQLSGLRAETLAARGKTVEEADAKALRYHGGLRGGEYGQETRNEELQAAHAGGRDFQRLDGAGDNFLLGRGGGAQGVRNAQVSLRAVDGFDPIDRMARDPTGQNSLPPKPPVGNMADDLARNARAAPPAPPAGPANPGMANPQAQAAYDDIARAKAQPTAPTVEPTAPKGPSAATAKPTLRAGLAAESGAVAKGAYAGGRLVGAVAKATGPAAIGADVVSHFNDYKIDNPDVDSSAAGTWNALKQGDFSGAGRSASKGALETVMDLGSFAANTLDYVVPGKAPVSTAYDRMLRNQFGSQLIGATGRLAAEGKHAVFPNKIGAAVKSAVAFIERHAAGADKIHSERWLKELGLDPKNVPLDADGHLITDKSVLMQQKGVGKSQAEREIDAVHYAINRWVEGAILTPNAAQRPAWGSDPHYSMFFHLKQFSYSFHQTILKRAVKEMNHGNLAPMGAFVWYIPTMIAADITKGLIQGGGELPAYMKGYDAGDWVMHGVQRAGLLGAAQLGVDAQGDMFSLAGPGVEQAIDAMREPIGQTMLKAAPAHGLYAEAFR